MSNNKILQMKFSSHIINFLQKQQGSNVCMLVADKSSLLTVEGVKINSEFR